MICAANTALFIPPSPSRAMMIRNRKCPAHIIAPSAAAGPPMFRMRRTVSPRIRSSFLTNFNPLILRDSWKTSNPHPTNLARIVPATMPYTPIGCDQRRVDAPPRKRADPKRQRASRNDVEDAHQPEDEHRRAHSPAPRSAAEPTRLKPIGNSPMASSRRYRMVRRGGFAAHLQQGGENRSERIESDKRDSAKHCGQGHRTIGDTIGLRKIARAHERDRRSCRRPPAKTTSTPTIPRRPTIQPPTSHLH